MAFYKSSEIASAINSLHIDQADQGSLLDVMEEYFTLLGERRLTAIVTLKRVNLRELVKKFPQYYYLSKINQSKLKWQ